MDESEFRHNIILHGLYYLHVGSFGTSNTKTCGLPKALPIITIIAFTHVLPSRCIVLRKVVVKIRADATVSEIPEDAIVSEFPHTLGERRPIVVVARHVLVMATERAAIAPDL